MSDYPPEHYGTIQEFNKPRQILTYSLGTISKYDVVCYSATSDVTFGNGIMRVASLSKTGSVPGYSNAGIAGCKIAGVAQSTVTDGLALRVVDFGPTYCKKTGAAISAGSMLQLSGTAGAAKAIAQWGVWHGFAYAMDLAGATATTVKVMVLPHRF